MIKKITQDQHFTDPNGFVRMDCILTNVGVMPYVQDDGTLAYGYLSEEELLKLTTRKQNLVLTNEHAGMIHSDNYQQHSIGHCDGQLRMDAGNLIGEVVLIESQAIQDFIAGKRDVSIGYDETIDYTPGIYVDSEGNKYAYDFIKKDLILNHLSLVDQGRAKNARLVLDANPTNIENMDIENKQIENIEQPVVAEDVQQDASEVQTDSDISALTAIVTALATKVDQIATSLQEEEETELELQLIPVAVGDSSSELLAAQNEIAGLKAAIALQQDKQYTEADVQNAVQARFDAWQSVGFDNKTISFDAALTPLEIKRAFLQASVGDSVDLSEKDESFIDGLSFAMSKKPQAKVADSVSSKTAQDSVPASNYTKRADGTTGFSMFNNR